MATQKTIRWMSRVSGAFHLQLFLVTTSSLILSFLDHMEYKLVWIRFIDGAVVLAYLWDMWCINQGVIPFSRCKKGSEIIGHHAPILLIFIPMAIPLLLQFSTFEPMIEFAKIEPYALQLYLEGNGWGFMSSLNEFIMCMQTAELNHNEKLLFWNSKTIQLVELSFKVGIFTIFSSISCFKSCQIDFLVWNSLSIHQPTLTIAEKLLWTYGSPMQLRTIAWRIFAITQYPKMAQRTMSKFKALHETTSINKKST